MALTVCCGDIAGWLGCLAKKIHQPASSALFSLNHTLICQSVGFLHMNSSIFVSGKIAFVFLSLLIHPYRLLFLASGLDAQEINGASWPVTACLHPGVGPWFLLALSVRSSLDLLPILSGIPQGHSPLTNPSILSEVIMACFVGLPMTDGIE